MCNHGPMDFAQCVLYVGYVGSTTPTARARLTLME